jgi:hypothetical protein
MSVTDIQVVEAIAKESWPDDQMEKQFYDGHVLLEELEKKKPLEVSPRGAVTAIQTGRGGGVSMVPSTGTSSLNKADGPKVNRATWKLARIRNAVELDTAVVKQVSGEPKSVAAAVDLATSDNLSTMQLQLTRQLAMDQKGLICQLASNTTTTTLKLATSGSLGLGREVMRNGWLPVGQQIDIGTTAEEAVIADGVTITGYNPSETEPSITISGSNVTTTGSHYVSLRNARAGATSYEANGFRNLAGEATLGEINPATEPTWKGGFLDTSGGPITRQRVIEGRRKAKTRANGKQPDWAFTSPELIEKLENETFQQVRFTDPGKQNLGDGETTAIGSLRIDALMESPIGDFTYARKEYLFALRIDKPYWCGEKFGGGMFVTQPGSTFVYGDQEYFVQMCVTRRNTISQFQGLE